MNKKNIVDYLKNKDLWKSSLYNNSRFEEDLSKLKGLNIKIKEIFWFYNYLVDNKEEEFENDVVNNIKRKEEEIIKQKELEKKLEKDQGNQRGGKKIDADSDTEENNSDEDDDDDDVDSDSDKDNRKKPNKGSRRR